MPGTIGGHYKLCSRSAKLLERAVYTHKPFVPFRRDSNKDHQLGISRIHKLQYVILNYCLVIIYIIFYV